MREGDDVIMISGLSTNEIPGRFMHLYKLHFGLRSHEKKRSIIIYPKMKRKMLSVFLLPATSTVIDSTNFSSPFKRVATAKSAKVCCC